MRLLGNAASLVLLALAACAVPPSDANEPSATQPALACKLTPEELQERRDGLLPGFIKRAEKVVDLDDGLSLRFQHTQGLLQELVQVIEAERCCCTFLRFRLTAEPGEGPITMDVTGPPGTRELLRSL